MALNTAAMLREGYESYRRYVNPLVTQRAELLGEPTRITAVEAGRLVEPRGVVEDFHGTQAPRSPSLARSSTPRSSW